LCVLYTTTFVIKTGVEKIGKVEAPRTKRRM
jgi:hypothetical protein